MRIRLAALLLAAGVGTALGAQATRQVDRSWTTEFALDSGELVTSGRNPHFILEPGYALTLEDPDAEGLTGRRFHIQLRANERNERAST